MQQLVGRMKYQAARLFFLTFVFGCITISWQVMAEQVVAQVPDRYYYATGRLCNRIVDEKSILRELIDHVGPASSSVGI